MQMVASEKFLDYGHVDNVWKENPYGVDESGGQRKDLLRVFRGCHGDDEQWGKRLFAQHSESRRYLLT